MSSIDQYRFEVMGQDFDSVWRTHAARLFDGETQVFHVGEILSDEERENLDRLRRASKPGFELRMGVFLGDELVGWHYGRQEPSHSYYMQNSAIFPNHRRKGLYSKLVKEVVARATAAGFQTIWSRHRTTNNDVIIPKLKAGFIITGVEVDDGFGTLVQLKYITHPFRKKMYDYRVGHRRPDAEILKSMGIKITD